MVGKYGPFWQLRNVPLEENSSPFPSSANIANIIKTTKSIYKQILRNFKNKFPKLPRY